MPLGRAASYKPAQRASGGTQNTFTARYSSASSGSAPSDSSATSRAWRYSNASEMYFKEDQPSTKWPLAIAPLRISREIQDPRVLAHLQ